MRRVNYLLWAVFLHDISQLHFIHTQEGGLEMVSTSTLPYFRVPVHFRAIDFCRDLWSGPTPELDERNIHFGELLCKAGKETRLLTIAIILRCWQALSVRRQFLAKNEAGEVSMMVILECSASFCYYLWTGLGRSCSLVSSLQDQRLPVCVSCW